MEINQLKDVASQVRRDIIRMVHACQSGHPGGSLGATDIVTALYFNQMQIDPENFKMDGAGEDMFFLSNGHISPMFYSILAHRGYFPVAELATFLVSAHVFKVTLRQQKDFLELESPAVLWDKVSQ